MKKIVLAFFTTIMISLWAFSARAQPCVLDCTANSGGTVELTWTVTENTGDPCVLTVEIVRTGTITGQLNQNFFEFSNDLTCTNCPFISGPTSTTIYTLTSTLSDCTMGVQTVAWANAPPCAGPPACVLDIPDPLPVELLSFKGATSEDEITNLSWSTASEENNKGFEIEHAVDGRNWEYIDFINGNGTTADIQEYTYSHRSPQVGPNYYRLKQIDYDGAFEYSDIVNVKIGNKSGGMSIVPNPVKSNRSLTVNIEKGINGTLRVFNLMGQVVYQTTVLADTNSYSFSMPDVASGIYMAVIGDGQNQFSERLVVY